MPAPTGRLTPSSALRLAAALPLLALPAALAHATESAPPPQAKAATDPKAATGRSFVERFASIDDGRWLLSHGWSNGDHQDCTFQASNAVIAQGGGLELTLREAEALERPSSCAELQTHEMFGYGTYEVRVRSAHAPGLVTSFFTYTGPGQAPGLPHDEIDFEFLGRSASTVQLNYFAAGKGDHGHDVELGFDPARTMADYAFEWTPEGIRWFVNGREVHAVRRQEGQPFPVTPGKICLSIWNGRGPDMETWLAPFDSAKRPLTARYERVAFTRWGEPCQFPESLVCRRNAKGSSTR